MNKSISTAGGESAAQKRARGRPALHATVEPDVILRNARRTFGKRGFDATSVREIARDSGVDAALVAHRFGNKEALWAAVIDQIAEQMVTTVAATVALRDSGLDAARRVERAISLLIEQVFDDPDVGLFFSTAASEEGERLEFLIDRLVRPYHDALLPLLVEAIKDGPAGPSLPRCAFATACRSDQRRCPEFC